MKHVAIIVAHPDDETLWAGGTILSNPHWKCYIVCLCRADDNDRSQRFYKALRVLRSEGIMGNLDDGPEQEPLAENVVENKILMLLPSQHYDLIISHNPVGEYTRHLRHKETGAAVIALWNSRMIMTKKLWTFAYEDGNNAYYPRPEKDATIIKMLTKQLWQKKYNIIIHSYGFKKNSWEARVTPKNEAFHEFSDSLHALQWLSKHKNQHI
jgi:LmbE family N-acetylglucosaminyl deacetylase